MNKVVQRTRYGAERPVDAQKEEHDERAGRKPERTVDDALNETKSSEHGVRYPEWSLLARDPAAREARPQWEAGATPLTRTVCRATFDVQVANLSPPLSASTLSPSFRFCFSAFFLPLASLSETSSKPLATVSAAACGRRFGAVPLVVLPFAPQPPLNAEHRRPETGGVRWKHARFVPVAAKSGTPVVAPSVSGGGPALNTSAVVAWSTPWAPKFSSIPPARKPASR